MGHISHVGVLRNAYKILVGRLEVRRPLGRSRSRYEVKVKTDHKEIVCGYVD